MALTRDFRQTVAARLERDPAFARAMLDEAATLFLNGEPETARTMLRDLVNATIGFEPLAKLTGKPAKRPFSLALSRPLDNLATIFDVLRRHVEGRD